jgi:hypothetical protein
MSSYKSHNLFGSGPHRFRLAPQGNDVVANYILSIPGSGSTSLGTLEVDVIVEGRLVGASESALWTLRDAITAEIAHPASPGTLTDDHARSWPDMCLITYEELAPPDRGRAFSLAYRATFRRFN